MYNEELKTRYLEKVGKQDSSRVVKALEAQSETEQRLGKDICTMSDDELRENLQLRGVSKRSQERELQYLKAYAKWCIANGVEGSCDALLRFKVDATPWVASKYVSSPWNLRERLDLLFRPVPECGLGVVYRCFFWLAFSGIKDEDAIRVRVKDIDLEHRRVYIRRTGDTYWYYREAIPDFEFAVKSESFLVNGKERQRVGGDLLLRGVRHVSGNGLNLDNFKVSMKRRQAKGAVPLTYTQIYKSGMCYNFYRSEQFGTPFDPLMLARSDIYGICDDLTDKSDLYDRVHIRKVRYQTEYEDWKRAFGLKDYF